MVKQPNIIILLMDSVRAANLSCYGYQQVTTPQIDAIAAEGTLYEQAISVGCWTLPVHTSLFTGLYPLNHNVTISKAALPSNVPTLAQQLKAHGYQTASFSNNAYVSSITGLTQGFDRVEDLWQANNTRGIQRTKLSKLIKSLERRGKLTKPLVHLLRTLQNRRAMMKRSRNTRDDGAQRTNAKIQQWLTTERNQEQPFFIFVNYMECHEPYRPPYPYNEKFLPKRFSAKRAAQVGSNKEVMQRLADGQGQDDVEILRALYDGELHYLDQQIGNLVQFLKSKGLLDDTMLVITADHGDCLGEQNQIGHRMALCEPLVHVPLIIRHPTYFHRNERNATQVSLIDLYPTCLALAGAALPPPDPYDFHSLLDTPDPDRSCVFAENTAPRSLNSMISRSVRTDRYKYIWNSTQAHELYDLVNDPQETVNLIYDEPAIAQKLQRELDLWQSRFSSDQVETAQAEYEDIVLERLRDLGYVE